MNRVLTLLAAGITALVHNVASAETGTRVALPICTSTPSHYSRTQFSGSVEGSSFVPGAACPNGDCSGQWGWTDYEVPAGGSSSARLLTASPNALLIKPVLHLPWTQMNWGDGNEILGSLGQSCIPAWDYRAARIDFSLAPDALLHVQGFVSNIVDSPVHAEVVYGMYGGTAPVVMAIQVLGDSGWVDVATRYTSTCNNSINDGCNKTAATLDASVPANSDVRLELRKAPNSNYGNQFLLIQSASLFGVECFPDAANPGMCLP